MGDALAVGSGADASAVYTNSPFAVHLYTEVGSNEYDDIETGDELVSVVRGVVGGSTAWRMAGSSR